MVGLMVDRRVGKRAVMKADKRDKLLAALKAVLSVDLKAAMWVASMESWMVEKRDVKMVD